MKKRKAAEKLKKKMKRWENRVQCKKEIGGYFGMFWLGVIKYHKSFCNNGHRK